MFQMAVRDFKFYTGENVVFPIETYTIVKHLIVLHPLTFAWCPILFFFSIWSTYYIHYSTVSVRKLCHGF